MSRNRIWNVSNPNQGSFKKVLCVCSAGLLRSPTAARILTMPPFNFNTRAVGLDSGHALIPLDGVHLHWADDIIVMSAQQQRDVIYCLNQCGLETKAARIHNLDVDDVYGYRDPALEEILTAKFYSLFLAIPLPERLEPVENATTQGC